MEPKGKAKLKCYHKDKEYELDFQVVDGNSPAIIGRDACTELGLIKRVFKIGNEDNILGEYEDLFTGLGCVPGLHHIQLDKEVPPVIHAPRKVPVALKDKVKVELNRMEDI
ncbi:hypothetical protein N1851_003463 [Merluccius polli]|uniref:Uncharacterized protein n=1 Tax=Merluccius polli TaxID=89951 RepID=A0AA47P835_MERPO|nr:hypothetical protein N1851_003463 [Merluccius polli]